MEQAKLKQLIFKVLKSDNRLWNEKKIELNQTLLLDLVEKIDEKIIDLLLQEKDLREKFFVNIKDAYVFKTNDFRFFMEENKVDNSYTDYKNKIGLTDSKKFLKDTNDVVLDFPYKDCVLEGGQSTEEGIDTYSEYDEETKRYEEKQGKRKEIFFNQVLAYDEIDRLFDPKALVNWKRYTKDGEQEVKELKRYKDGTIKENLIIKGNNLLSLHSLKKQFAGRVKLIYIDPPYNTGNDGFKYNDNFNHSTWLTFMKNRLEVARELLKDDGVIFVQCDDNEQAYLKVLMDEVFQYNFISTFIIKSNPRGRQTSKLPLALTHEYVMCYSKLRDSSKIYETKITQEIINEYKLEDKFGKYRLLGLRKRGTASNREDRPNLYYEIYYDVKTKSISTIKSNETITIIPLKEDRSEGVWRWQKSKVEKDKNLLFVKEVKRKTGEVEYDLFVKDYLNNQGENKGIKTKSILDDKHFNNEFGTEHLKNLFGGKLFDYPKSEYLLERIIEISTQPNDIVLDYHLGSGTTCAVAHKMERQYIGVEQMDYIETITVERLKKVIQGEQGGISKSVNWQGGGDFIYFELAKWNETAKEKILACESLEELITFFDEMYGRYFLNYNLKIKEFREKVIYEKEFKNLSLEEQKKIFIAMLDNNQMYVNKTEMADKKYGINEEDQRLTENFYHDEE